MSCSKIYLEDLPELTNEIIQYFRDDYSTLHSCILVNRLWCRLAIPLLWEDPFSIPTRNYHFIEIYLHNLNEDDKIKLSKYDINSNLFPSNTLFNYPSFIKYFCRTLKTIHCISAWTSSISTTLYYDCLRVIHDLLLKTFIENEACLQALAISDLYVGDDYLNTFFELISQNPNFIHNIKRLELQINYQHDISNKIITFLSSNCKLISTLDTHFNARNYSLIIKSQQNLQKFSFTTHHSLLSLKNSNCSNTLKTIIFSGVDFRNVVILNEVFEQLNVLESVHLLNCRSLDVQFMQQIINITKPFKLKSLIMMYEDTGVHVESFQLLLQKSGNYLENIGLSSQTLGQSQQKLFELITKYCTNIKFFDLSSSIEAYTYLAFDLIKNIGQNLNYLSIEYNEAVSSIVTQNLGRIIPLKLEYLSITFSAYNASDFEEFLKNSHNTFINTLLITIVDGGGGGDRGEDVLPYVEKYIMKEKRVKHLAITINRYGEVYDWSLFYFKDVVKKFKLYNIKVRHYSDLGINYSELKKNKIFLDIFQ